MSTVGAAAVGATGEWGECLVPAAAVPPALGTEVRRLMGVTPGWLPRLAALPWLARACATMAQRRVVHTTPEVCDLVALVVSQDNSCRYCYGIQRAVLRIHGYREEAIDRLVREVHSSELAPPDRAALQFARRLSRADPRPVGRDLDDLAAAGFSRAAVAEVVAIVAAANFMNRLATLIALPQESLERLVQARIFPVVRPLLAWMMRRTPTTATAPPPNDGPYAPLVAALGDAPIAGTLRQIIDDAWASPTLPRRTKGLVFAVVARALGCRYGEEEARALLAQEGFGSAELDEVLRTLASPRLDAREAKLVRFARETVRYQPSIIQPRVRDVCRDLAPAEALEAVGVAALANGLCRLSVVLDAPR